MERPKIVKKYQVSKPLLFIIYNKPEETEKVFKIIQKVKPKKIYIAADGPSQNATKSELEKISQTRSIVKKINWKCSVKTLFREQNLGCKLGVTQAITWFFQNESEGIILEDDCLPNIYFFEYCDKLLDKYKHNTRISSISGSNPYEGGINIHDSYLFSSHSQIWGWATWKRVWDLYDVNMKDWKNVKDSGEFCTKFYSERAYTYWKNLFQKCFEGKIDTWDYQFFFCQLKNNLLTIVPSKNLVSNIGFGKNATHTKFDIHSIANLPTRKLHTPYIHPSKIEVNTEYDTALEKQLSNKNLFTIARNIIIQIYVAINHN